jgi:hypothetical protein
MHSVLELGWSATSSTRATITPESRSHGRRIASTLTPCLVSRSARSSGARSVGQNSRSHETGTRIAYPTPSNCPRKRTSFS